MVTFSVRERPVRAFPDRLQSIPKKQLIMPKPMFQCVFVLLYNLKIAVITLAGRLIIDMACKGSLGRGIRTAKLPVSREEIMNL